MTTDPRRALPAVGAVLDLPSVRALAARAPRALLADVVREVIDGERAAPGQVPPSDAAWAAAVARHLDQRLAPTLRRVINATGVVLHTNLGRAPLAAAALAAVAEVAQDFSNLEYDVALGARGARHVHCARLLAELTGADDALVVNNCAAALVLALNTLADGRDAVISRGELVEIGDSFRVPDIMRKSGAVLVEVGTTNRTHAHDYTAALSDRTGAIVSVHRSNFALEGFVATVPLRELASLAAAHAVPVVHDFGSGLLIDLAPWGLTGEPIARDAVRDGASLVVMSGDKLLGGPQAGVIVGNSSLIDRLRRNPLARALRVDKLTIAALAATLELYRDPAVAVREVPALAMLCTPLAALEQRASRLAGALTATLPAERAGAGPARGYAARVIRAESTVGGGAFPTSRLPSAGVALEVPDPTQLEARLRSGAVPVVARIENAAVVLDMRTVHPAHDEELIALVVAALA